MEAIRMQRCLPWANVQTAFRQRSSPVSTQEWGDCRPKIRLNSGIRPRFDQPGLRSIRKTHDLAQRCVDRVFLARIAAANTARAVRSLHGRFHRE